MLDIVIDIRKSSPRFGQWVDEYLSAKVKRLQWNSEGLAHGFYVANDEADFVYKCTSYYNSTVKVTFSIGLS